MSRPTEPRDAAYTATSGPVQIAEDIMPIAELKANIGDVMRGLDERRPIIITLNGRAAGVLMSPREFDRLTAEQRFRAAVQEGLEHAATGRIHTEDEVFAMLAEERGNAATPVKRTKRR